MRFFRIFASLIVVTVVVSTPAPIDTLRLLRADDTEEIIGYQEWNGEHLLEKNVVVKPGATLVVNKGANLVFSGQASGIRVEGSLFIKGSVKEQRPVKTKLPGIVVPALETESGIVSTRYSIKK